MNEEKLKELLGRYYRGESTEAGERELKEYFSGKDILQGYDAEKEMFAFFSAEESMAEPSECFRDRIIKNIDDSEKSKTAGQGRKRFIYILSSAAAAVLLIVASYLVFFTQKKPQDTFSDPQLAYAETMRILNEVSLKLNKGSEALKPISRLQSMTTGISSVDRSAEVISKNLQRIRILEDIPKNGKQLNNKDIE